MPFRDLIQTEKNKECRNGSKDEQFSLTFVSENGPELSSQRGLHEHVDVLFVPECFVQPENSALLFIESFEEKEKRSNK
jgi:hypothetical protein